MCGNNDPGPNSQWYDNFSLCGPCHSLTLCTACEDGYEDGELIIQCNTCQRWCHGECDAICTEEEAEQCAVAGYACQLCRPTDEPPPHIVQVQWSCKFWKPEYQTFFGPVLKWPSHSTYLKTSLDHCFQIPCSPLNLSKSQVVYLLIKQFRLVRTIWIPYSNPYSK